MFYFANDEMEKRKLNDHSLVGIVIGRGNETVKKNFLVGTDFGVYTLPHPVEGFREWIACLMDCGWTDEEIRMVTTVNPAYMLDIDLNESAPRASWEVEE